MTTCASFALEYLLARFRLRVERIRIGRRLKRVNIEGERVERSIWQPRAKTFGTRKSHALPRKVDVVGEAHERRVAHEVADVAVQMGAGVIDVLPILDADEVGDLGGIEDAAVPARHAAAPDACADVGIELGAGDFSQLLAGGVVDPGGAVGLVGRIADRAGQFERHFARKRVLRFAYGGAETVAKVVRNRKRRSPRHGRVVGQVQQMARAAVREPHRHAVFRRDPAQAVDRAIGQRAGAARLHGLETAGHGDDLGIECLEHDGVEKHALAGGNPVRLRGELLLLDQRLRAHGLNVLPVTCRFAIRHVQRIAAEVFLRDSVVVRGGHVRRGLIETGQGSRPTRELRLVPHARDVGAPRACRVIRGRDRGRGERQAARERSGTALPLRAACHVTPSSDGSCVGIASAS